MSGPAPFKLESDTPGVLRLSGEISYSNAALAIREAPQGIIGQAAAELDLKGLRRADSATLAVLIAWSARARRQGTKLRYTNAPAGLLNLARLCDVDELLALG